MEELTPEETVVVEPAPVEEAVAPVEEPAVEEVAPVAEEPVVEEPVVEEAPKKRTRKVAEPEPIPADVQVVKPELPRSAMAVARSRKRP
jgi:fused signal recognition particle receptor